MGPSALRLAGLNERVASLGYEVRDLGNVLVNEPESVPVGVETAKYLREITGTCQRLAALVYEAVERGQLPLVLGGDHSIAIGTVSGLASYYRERGEKIGLIWIDAHADMNTPDSSPSGNVHGMPLACLLGIGPGELTHLSGYSPKVEPANVALIGLRDVDRTEASQVHGIGVTTYTMRAIDEKGMRNVVQEAIGLASNGTVGIHVSFDMDALDPDEAPGVGTPVRGGLTYREAHLAMELLCDCGGVIGLEIVEVNPVLDQVNRTAALGVELAMSVLGKRIL